MEINAAAEKISALKNEISKGFVGQAALVEKAILTLLAGGHLLIEGVPGLGKTLLVRCIAQAIRGESARVQFTPDLMPSDITGNIMLESGDSRLMRDSMKFITKKGPVFTNLFIADEINRAPAKTQAALFEAMQEYSVSLDGVSYPLPRPFITLATENPLEHEGTYPLPDAQKDRFLMKVTVDYPLFEEETRMVKLISAQKDGGASLSVSSVNPVFTTEEFCEIQALLPSIESSTEIIDYAVRIVRATREDRRLEFGAGPRGSLALIRAGRALALMNSRDFVLPDDIKNLAVPVLNHRLTLSAESELEGLSETLILKDLIEKTPAPR